MYKFRLLLSVKRSLATLLVAGKKKAREHKTLKNNRMKETEPKKSAFADKSVTLKACDVPAAAVSLCFNVT